MPWLNTLNVIQVLPNSLNGVVADFAVDHEKPYTMIYFGVIINCFVNFMGKSSFIVVKSLARLYCANLSEFARFGKPCIISPDCFKKDGKLDKENALLLSANLTEGVNTIEAVIFDLDLLASHNCMVVPLIIELLKDHPKIVISLRNIFSASGPYCVSYSSNSPFFASLNDIGLFSL